MGRRTPQFTPRLAVQQKQLDERQFMTNRQEWHLGHESALSYD